MKSIIVLFLFTIWLIIPTAASHGFLNEPDGFRGIKWGTDISVLSGMRIVIDNGNIKYYTRDNDEMELSGTQIDAIRYIFYEGKLHEVQFLFHDFLNFNNIRNTCFNLYGRDGLYGVNYYWFGKTTTISLRYSAEDKHGELAYVGALVYKDILKSNNE